MVRMALFVSALLISISAFASQTYDEHLDEFTGDKTYTSEKIAKTGGSLVGTSSYVRLVKIVRSGGDREYKFIVRAVTGPDDWVDPENSLLVKLDNVIHMFTATKAHNSSNTNSGYHMVSFDLEYSVGSAFVDTMAIAGSVSFRVERAGGQTNFKTKSKQHKQLLAFIEAVRGK